MDDWCKRTMRSRIEPMKKIARMLRSHRSLILKWFRAREQIALGAVEGLNNKAKVTVKKACGFRSLEGIKLAHIIPLANMPLWQSSKRNFRSS
jgi:transposase